MHFLRDPTRGGVSAVLHELAEAAGVSVEINETAVPLSPAVRGACELFGLDPLYVANEGKVVAVMAADAADAAARPAPRAPLGSAAALIGVVGNGDPPQVVVRGPLGRLRVLDEPSGAPLPRIC